jgi:hypothetical protein
LKEAEEGSILLEGIIFMDITALFPRYLVSVCAAAENVICQAARELAKGPSVLTEEDLIYF